MTRSEYGSVQGGPNADTDGDSDIASSVPSSDTEPAVGLSNPQFSQGRRKMLELINRLHSTGVQVDLDLPVVAVIGSQSAGKSSLIESISGITLPRAAGTCTRCPTECKLSYSDGPWSCTVYLRFIKDENGATLGQAQNFLFGSPISDKSEVEERIRRAQLAILNPRIPYAHFLSDDIDDDIINGRKQLTFSTNYVSLEITGREVADLSFVDLPGLIASVGNGGNDGDIDLVRSLVVHYISRPSCLILLTVACETDFENQGAHHLAKLHDPEGVRTIGVLTKPDRIPPGEEERWLRFIRNDYEPLLNNWFCVKQPDSRSLARGISWNDARTAEQKYFSSKQPWCDLESVYQNHLRTSNLTERLSAILSQLIAVRLPELQNELQKLLEKTDESIRQLPRPPSEDPFGELLQLTGAFTRDLARHLEGTPDEDGLLQSIRPAQEVFKNAVRLAAPNFRPYERLAAPTHTLTPPEFLENEEDENTLRDIGEQEAIYLDEVMDRAEKARTRELPDHYPFIVHEVFISEATKKWEVPARRLCHAVNLILFNHAKRAIARHFEGFEYGGLLQRVILIVTEHIKECMTRTIDRIEWLIRIESRPFTLNIHYYSDYRDKFLSHYKASRKSLVYEEDPQAISDAISSLVMAGYTDVQKEHLPKLLPPDPYERALNIMACVRAYFQVAYKRFSDNIPLAIDQELIRGLGHGLEQALHKGLGMTGRNSQEACKEFIQEHPSTAARREELRNKRERLDSANQQLMHLGL